MRVKIQVTDAGLALTPCKYNRGERYVGTAILSNVTVKDNACTGDLVGEYLEEYPLDTADIPKSVRDRMQPLTETVKSARVVYAVGSEILYLPE